MDQKLGLQVEIGVKLHIVVADASSEDYAPSSVNRSFRCTISDWLARERTFRSHLPGIF